MKKKRPVRAHVSNVRQSESSSLVISDRQDSFRTKCHHPRHKLQSKKWLKLGLRASYVLACLGYKLFTFEQKILYTSNLVLRALFERYIQKIWRVLSAIQIWCLWAQVQCALQTKPCPLIPGKKHKRIHKKHNAKKAAKKKKTMHKAATEHTYTMELPNHLSLHSSITTRSAKQAFQPSSLHLAILIHGCSIGICGGRVTSLPTLQAQQKQGFCGGWMLNPNMTYHWPSKCQSLAQNEEGQLQCTGQHFLRIACNAFSIASVEG